MGDTPLLSPLVPRIAPPRLHTPTPSRSSTRQRLADDILSDLTPATTLEAFKSPSGRLKTSIELATPSEQAFGLRAALASKSIQEWLDELSDWPWPAEGGSLGFEVPPAKRRKLSSPTLNDYYEQNSIGETSEPECIGSLLASEVRSYEIRIDEITADMEELNVEEIKRQVLDTHFSPKSRPSSSSSNAPMPSLLSSYTKMDDFTAVVTATVLQALPNLSRLTRLIDIWSIRLAVLRKVPPLLLALEDAEIALKSGWDTINKPGSRTSNREDVALSRETFGVMRDVLQNKVTTLGQELDYMLDTLEGREDTLPESWLDRMEAIEQDYGEWVVSGDRKVREGEWAKMAKARKDAEDARKLKEAAAAKVAEEAEIARQEAQKEAEEAEAAETAKRKAEQEAEVAKTARRQVLRDAEDAHNAKLATQRTQKEAEEAHAAETAKRKAENEAQEAEILRLQELKDAEYARNAETSRREAEKQAEEAEVAEVVRRQAEREVQEAESARQQEQKEERDAKSTMLQFLKDTEELEMARQLVQKGAEGAEIAKQQAQELEAEVNSQQAQRNLQDAETTEAAIPRATSDGEDEVAKQIEASSVKSPELRDASEPEGSGVSAFDVALPTLADEAVLATVLPKKSSVVRDASANISRFSPFDGNNSEDSEPPVQTSEDLPSSRYDGADQFVLEKSDDELVPMESSLASPIHFNASQNHSSLKTRTPKAMLSTLSDPEDSESPQSHKIPRTDHALTNFHCPTAPPNLSSPERPRSSEAQTNGPAMESKADFRPHEVDPVHLHYLQTSTRAPFDDEMSARNVSLGQPNDAEWIVTDSSEEKEVEEVPPPPTQSSDSDINRRLETDGSRSKRHSRNISILTGYSTAAPTSEVHEAGPTEYFHPAFSPITTAQSPVTIPEPTSPSESFSDKTTGHEGLPILDGSERPPKYPSVVQLPGQALNTSLPSNQDTLALSTEINSGGDLCGACDEICRETQAEEKSVPVLARTASITRINSGIRQISIPSPRRGSISSDSPMIVTGRVGNNPSSPIASPLSPRGPLEPFLEADESPSAGRIGLRIGKSYDYSPPDSPPPIPAISKPRPLQFQQAHSFSTSDPTAPLTPLEPPLLDDIDISPAPLSSPKKASSDDQLQQQISTLLESIPARIHLTSEPDAGHFSRNTLRPKKTRRSITPSLRSSSSMSNYSTNSYTRAPTPSFTLAPAFAKTSHRSRTPGNPEIKLYHLSRSTGEAPIKLFVRLVGEHGERVMVRVGGGWADLGEYLREYASHHGRRTVADDKVEIQDLPPRTVSNSSTISSSATIRGNGRDSPISRPQSVLERPIERPGSSLNISKTRKSLGESEYAVRGNEIRSPTTPLPNINRLSYETPPSVTGSEASSSGTGPSHRSSSRLSWTEEDSSLGLAGPKSKKVVISEKDQEWVESMKEKVRQASAEKEKRNRERELLIQRKTSFGEMEKVGGTKRLFRKSGA